MSSQSASTLNHSSDGHIWNVAKGELTSGLTTQAARQDSTTTYPTTYDAIVVGAGFAGLVAARDLTVAGKKVLLLEARDRIGGRTFTAKGLHHSYEIGGGWIHWLQPNVWAEMSRYGLVNLPASDPFNLAESITMCGGNDHTALTKIEPEVMMTRMTRLLQKFFDIDGMGGRTVLPQPYRWFDNLEGIKKYDITVAQRLQQMDVSPADRDFVAAWLFCMSLSSPETAGFLSFLRVYALSNYDWGTVLEMSGKFKVPGGTTALASAMHSEFTGISLFGRQVSSIVSKAGAAEVKTTAGEVFTAGKVVCTIPLNCLGDIGFEPALPVSFIMTHVNQGAKVNFHAEGQPGGWFGVGTAQGSGSFGLTESSSESGGKNMVIFLGADGFLAKNALKDKPKEMIEALHTDLIPKGSDIKFTDATFHDWRRDPFSKGAWCVAAAGQITGGLGDIAKRRWVSDNVRLTSADSADGWIGYIDGAIEQGRRAAFEIIQGL
ncbi:hypothetical protein AAE478_002009 [Parahypoxylon ruwenzoriense]